MRSDGGMAENGALSLVSRARRLIVFLNGRWVEKNGSHEIPSPLRMACYIASHLPLAILKLRAPVEAKARAIR